MYVHVCDPSLAFMDSFGPHSSPQVGEYLESRWQEQIITAVSETSLRSERYWLLVGRPGKVHGLVPGVERRLWRIIPLHSYTMCCTCIGLIKITHKQFLQVHVGLATRIGVYHHNFAKFLGCRDIYIYIVLCLCLYYY